MRLSCQLYTLRDPLSTQPEKTLEELRKTGLEYVEAVGLGSLTPSQERSIFDGLGLKVSASHVPLAQMESDIAKVIDEAKTIGTETIVVPWLPEEDRHDFPGLAAKLKPIGEKVLEAGFRFAYHNHNFEFEKSGGELGIDVLYGTIPSMTAQFDLGWIHYAGYSPTEYLSKYSGRIDSVHLKDSQRGHPTMDLAAGEGELDYASLIPASEAAGARYATIEVDEPRGDALEVVRGCVSYFHHLGLK